MKRLLFTLIIAFCFISTNAQQSRENSWILNVGFNALKNSQSQNPFADVDHWAIKNPVAISIERQMTKRFFLEGGFTLNGYDKGTTKLPITAVRDYNYYSFDLHAKLYFGDQIFKNSERIDLYANLGVGYFGLEETNTTMNFGGGVLYWLNERRTIGIRGQIIGKLASDNKNKVIDSNHYQYHLQAVIKL